MLLKIPKYSGGLGFPEEKLVFWQFRVVDPESEFRVASSFFKERLNPSLNIPPIQNPFFMLLVRNYLS